MIALILASCAGAAAATGLALKFQQGKSSKKILEEKETYAQLVNHANDALLVVDIVNASILHVNPSAEKMLGYTAEQFRNISLLDLHPPEYLEKSSNIVADVWEKGGLIYDDLPFVKADKTLIPVECSARVVSFRDRPGIVIYARDIADRLAMQKEIQRQNELISLKNKDITDSINYARGIQQAILPDRKILLSSFVDSFVLMQPRDIVSGDFYWFYRKENIVLIAAADCTGHGVPGALMSMIACSFMNEVVTEMQILEPAKILNEVRKKVIRILNQQSQLNDNRDGMDVSLVSINLGTREILFSGAFNPLVLVRKKELTEIKGDKFPVGAHIDKDLRPFTQHSLKGEAGDELYLFTDGFMDQFGGPDNKKFKKKAFLELLKKEIGQPMVMKKEMMKNAFNDWKGGHEQVDDVLVVGLRL